MQGLTIRDAAREYLRQAAATGQNEVTYGQIFDALQTVPTIKQNSAGGKPWSKGQNRGWRSLCITFASNPETFKTTIAGNHANRNDIVELIQPKSSRK